MHAIGRECDSCAEKRVHRPVLASFTDERADPHIAVGGRVPAEKTSGGSPKHGGVPAGVERARIPHAVHVVRAPAAPALPVAAAASLASRVAAPAPASVPAPAASPEAAWRIRNARRWYAGDNTRCCRAYVSNRAPTKTAPEERPASSGLLARKLIPEPPIAEKAPAAAATACRIPGSPSHPRPSSLGPASSSASNSCHRPSPSSTSSSRGASHSISSSIVPHRPAPSRRQEEDMLSSCCKGA